MAIDLADLKAELKKCDGRIQSERAPESVINQLWQGHRVSRQDLETLETYFESLKQYRRAVATLVAELPT